MNALAGLPGGPPPAAPYEKRAPEFTPAPPDGADEPLPKLRWEDRHTEHETTASTQQILSQDFDMLHLSGASEAEYMEARVRYRLLYGMGFEDVSSEKDGALLKRPLVARGAPAAAPPAPPAPPANDTSSAAAPAASAPAPPAPAAAAVRPAAGDRVTVHWRCRVDDDTCSDLMDLRDGYPPDRTGRPLRWFADEERSFLLGSEKAAWGEVRGLLTLVRTMAVGDRCVARLRPDYAYGRHGRASYGVEAGDWVEVHVHLLSAVAPRKPKFKMVRRSPLPWERPENTPLTRPAPQDDEEKSDEAEKIKTEALALWQGGKWAAAAACYVEAASWVRYTAEEPGTAAGPRARGLYVACCLNASAAHLKRRQWGAAADAAGSVLAVDGDNAKARYRRGLARSKLCMFAEARSDLVLAAKALPADRAIRKALEDLKPAEAAASKQRALTWKKAFGKGNGLGFADVPKIERDYDV